MSFPRTAQAGKDNQFHDDSDAWEFGASRQTHVEAGLASPAKYAKTKGGGYLGENYSNSASLVYPSIFHITQVAKRGGDFLEFATFSDFFF